MPSLQCAFFVLAFLVSLLCLAVSKNSPKHNVLYGKYSSSSSDQDVQKKEDSTFQKPDWITTKSYDKPLAGPKYEAARQILGSMTLPKSLARLIFNSNKTLSNEEISRIAYHMPIRVVGDDEYACINRCSDEMHNSSSASQPGNMTELCSQLEEVGECVVKCSKPHGIWSRYIHKVIKSTRPLVCVDEAEAKKLYNDNILGVSQCVIDVVDDNTKFFQGLKHIIGCYLEFEEAENNKDTCYKLKYNAIDSSFGMLHKFCGEKIDKRMLELSKSAVVIVLTILSDGRLLNECPLLYLD